MTRLLDCKHISKTFYGTQALDDVDFYLDSGEIVGLVGENGAGKSTLMKIVAGVYSYDSNKSHSDAGIYIQGEKKLLGSPLDAIKNGIITIHQEINVVYDLMVYENIFLNNYILKKNGALNRKAMIAECKELLNQYGITNIQPTDYVRSLSMDRQKLVEVIKALSNKACIIILDEPTSVLNQEESKHLFEIMGHIAKQGVGLVFISHNLKEIVEYCSRVVVLRDGKLIKVADIAEMDVESIVSCMVGKKLNATETFVSSDISPELILSVHHLNYKNKLRDISFDLHKGEILGMTGLIGSGGNDIAKCIFGCNGYKGDFDISFMGEPIKKMTPGKAIRKGIAFLTDDRKAEGLFPNFTIANNIIFPSLPRFTGRLGFLKKKKMQETAQEKLRALHIKAKSVLTQAGSLSGGNQQKVVVAKWITAMPKLLILSEPTIGIDVGAKYEIRRIISSLAQDGMSVILITNEYTELEKLCNRTLVMFEGRITREFQNNELNEEELIRCKLGGKIL